MPASQMLDQGELRGSGKAVHFNATPSRRTLIFWLIEVLYAREHFERLCPPSLPRKEGDDPDNDTNKHNNVESNQPALMELGTILSA